MPKYFFLLVLALSFPGIVFAQEYDTMAVDAVRSSKARAISDADWQATLENIKNDTSSLLDANQKLNSEYEFLKEKLVDLQDNFAKVKEENEKLQMQNEKLENSRSAKRRSYEALQQQLLKVQGDVGSLQSNNKPLRERLTKLEEQNEQMQQHLQGLQTQKREMLLDMKLQEASQGDMEQLEDDEIRKLNEQLSSYEQKEKELKAELESSQGDMEKVLSEIEDAVRQNSELEGQMSELKLKKDNQLKINAQLKKENERLSKSISEGPADLVKQRSALEAKISMLSKELDTIRKSVQESSAVLEKKRVLMDEVMKLDADNQALRDEIAKMLQTINDSKTESSSGSSAE